MRQKKTMLVLGIVLVLFVLVYLGLKAYQDHAKKQEEEQEKAETVRIIDEDALSEFSYSNGEQTMQFVKEDGVWYYAKDREIPMDQDAVEQIASAIAGLTATREFTSPDELEDYGLDVPAYTVDYKTEATKTARLFVGDSAGEDYYASKEGGATVYTSASTLVGSFQFELSSLVQNDTVPTISSGNLKKVEVTQGNQTDIYEEENDLASLAGGFGVLSLTDCADFHVTEEKLKDYGLDEANRMTVTASYQNGEEDVETFILYVGNTTEDGEKRYVLVDGSRLVYRVSADVIENMTTPGETEEESGS